MAPSWSAKRTLLAAAGLILSAYALYVEHRVAEEAQHQHDDAPQPFVALCDIEAIGASCSAVFALPQGRMLSYFGVVPEGSVLDLPNAALGLAHYAYLLTVQAALLLLMSKKKSRFAEAVRPLTHVAVTAALASTLFLAYQLTFVIFELCVLCWSTHVINAYTFYDHFFAGAGVGAAAAAIPASSSGINGTDKKKSS